MLFDAVCQVIIQTFHWSSIVNIALTFTVFDLFDSEKCHDLDGSLNVIGNGPLDCVEIRCNYVFILYRF